MQHAEALKTEISARLNNLPLHSLQTLANFAAFLQAGYRRKPSDGRKIVKLGGLWEGTPDLTPEDIAEARREVWGKLGDRDIGMPSMCPTPMP